MSNITKRPYRILADYMSVYAFLQSNYTFEEMNGYMMAKFFEYAHTHCCFNKNMPHRMAVWEENGRIVAFCGYEMDIGEAYLVTSPEFRYLLPEMLAFAENNLAKADGEKHSLEVWVTSSQTEHIRLLENNGYRKENSEPISIYRYENGFPKLSLPAGFSCVSLENNIDLRKLNRCTWRGFNHGDNVEYNIDEMLYMANGPHHRPDLGRIIIAPDGEYTCYAGMWLDEKNSYAYLEPLCTQPEYRRMGLARYALTDAMQNTEKHGARYCFGGVPAFYAAIGFETVSQRQMWKKTRL